MICRTGLGSMEKGVDDGKENTSTNHREKYQNDIMVLKFL